MKSISAKPFLAGPMATEFEPDAFGPIQPNERAAMIARLANLAYRISFDGLNLALLENDLESLG